MFFALIVLTELQFGVWIFFEPELRIYLVPVVALDEDEDEDDDDDDEEDDEEDDDDDEEDVNQFWPVA